MNYRLIEASADLVAGGATLENELERRIAFYFLRFGKWKVEQELRHGPEGDAVAIDVVAWPAVMDAHRQATQEFAPVGMLASLYAALFDEATLSAEGEVSELEYRPNPGELATLIADDF